MRFTTLTAVSALTLMMSLPAYAQNASGGEAMAYDQSSSRTSQHLHAAAGDMRAFFLGKDSIEPILIENNLTAYGLIGESVVDLKGRKIANVKDIIVNKQGKAILIVVSDGGLLGIGSKVAAFDYDQVITRDAKGNIVMALSQDMVFHAVDFSYDQKDWAKARVIPPGSLSVSALLKGNLLDNRGKKVADVQNVYFRNADMTQVIVGFNKKLGMGGNLAALEYDDLQLVKKSQGIDFQLSSNQAKQFRNFRKSVAN